MTTNRSAKANDHAPAPLSPSLEVRRICCLFYIVKDHAGHNLAYLYFENEPGCRPASKLLSRGEARRIAVNIAKLPELLKAPKSPRRISASRRVRAAYPPSRR